MTRPDFHGTPLPYHSLACCCCILFSFMLLPLSEGVGGYMTTVAVLWDSASEDDYVACALEVGTLYPQCWGTPADYNGTSPPTNTSFWAISNGGYFVCGLLYDSHYPSCWGYLNNSAIPSQFQSTSYSNINSGAWHACAVRDNTTDNPGQVDCWGNNTYGQSSPPTEAMISVTAGDYYTCGLTASTRQVKCWGNMSITQDDSATIVQAPNASFDSIFAGGDHMCGLELTTMKTLCWGDYQEPPPNLNLTVISGGLLFSCGLREDTHEAACWGDGTDGETALPAGVKFSTISSGDSYTCGVREDQPNNMVVNCWGDVGDYDALDIPPTFKASMGLCVKQCNEGQREVLDSELQISLPQCPNNGDKVCVECKPGECPAANNSTSLRPLPPTPASNSPWKAIVVAVVLSVIALALGLLAVFRRRQLHSMWMSWRRRPIAGAESAHSTRPWKAIIASKVISFTSEEMQVATKNYDTVIGKGGFGNVYKGILDDGRVVAIKKASTEERASTFDMELELLAQLNHKYLVNLVGYCEEDKCLVFEFMVNGSLQDCLFDNKRPAQFLDWKGRMKVALQAARGIEYLHVYASPKIIHRDVKASNILLDEDWDAKIADFGLSLYGPVGAQTHISNLVPCGTPGYLDPEYFQTYQLNAKSDVYSFGVVLLELLSGRQALDRGHSVYSIVAWAMDLANQEKSILILDSELKVPDDVAQRSLQDVIQLSLQCVGMTGKERPTMSEVASCLQDIVKPFFTNEMKEAPIQISPKYLWESSSSSCSKFSTADHVYGSSGSSGIEMKSSWAGNFRA